jgi:hypothetical protein
MKWILYIMLFVTPPQNLTKAEIKDHELFELNRIWTLQSASTTELSSLDACFWTQDEIVSSITGVNVATMTARVWCACDSMEKTKPCPTEQEIIDRVKVLRAQAAQRRKNPAAPRTGLTIESQPPVTDGAVGGSFSMQRLFPPVAK